MQNPKRWMMVFGAAVIFTFWIRGISQAPDAFKYQPPQETSTLPMVYGEKPQNIILLIGDGMSFGILSAARIRAVGTTGKLHMDRMPIAGFVRTCSADKLITDSAAAATAMACGKKTNNGTIGQTPDGQSWSTILEICRSRGMTGGLVATSTITHATPAAFASHVPSRKGQDTIAVRFLENPIEVLLGGGIEYFSPKSAGGSKRLDERDLIAEARAKGYAVVHTREKLLAAQGPFLLGLFAPDGMTTQPPEPALAEMAGKAIELLTAGKRNFILMIEGSQIDWAASDNDLNGTIKQTLDFDMAVQKALEFALEDGRTLVVVTADHETGGAAIVKGELNGSKLEVDWAKKGHTGGSVPLYAFGPGADKFSGFLENTDIPKIIAALLGVTDFPRAAMQ